MPNTTQIETDVQYQEGAAAQLGQIPASVEREAAYVRGLERELKSMHEQMGQVVQAAQARASALEAAIRYSSTQGGFPITVLIEAARAFEAYLRGTAGGE